jgi:uncharacterized protein (TIGR03663 family)
MKPWNRSKTELILILVICFAAAFLRFYDLTEKPFHHDESLYSYFSWIQSLNGTYHYDPMMHGPFMYFLNVLIFFALGASNFTARLAPALFGTLLCLAPLLIRTKLGSRGALAAMALLACSPSVTYFSRFMREDIFAAFFTMAAAAFFVRYLETRRDRDLYLSAASLSLLYCTKENSYLHTVIFFAFALVAFAVDRVFLRQSELAFFRGGSPIAFLKKHKYRIVLSFYIFFGIFAVLFTNFGFSPGGFLDGLYRKSLAYWFEQHKIQRLAGPFDLYLLLLAVYELPVLAFMFLGFLKDLWSLQKKMLLALILLLVAAGAWILTWLNYPLQAFEIPFSNIFSLMHIDTIFQVYLLLMTFFLGALGTILYLARGLRFRAFLFFWSSSAFFLYSYAGEKAPWLVVHIVLPLILLAASYLNEFSSTETFKKSKVALTALFVSILAFQAGNTIRSSFFRPSNPEEMLVYTQTTKEIQELVQRIESTAKAKKLGPNIPMCVEGEAIWPLSWYLRDYKDWFQQCTQGSFSRIMLITDWSRKDELLPYMDKVFELKRYKLRHWWIPRFSSGFEAVREFLKYFIDRKIFGNPIGSTDIAVFFRRDIEDADFFKGRKIPESAESVEKLELVPVASWGREGGKPGEFREPRDIAVSKDGFVYVADTKNHRIEKFSKEGDFILTFGSEGAGAGQFNQPTGVGVDKLGNVYVADTWNHRIQVFKPSGEFIREFKGGREGFWAPKDVDFDLLGNIYVVDTGYHRVQEFSPEGTFLKAWGGKGERIPGVFSEPVGIYVREGREVFVADTGNHRVQVFTEDGKPLRTIPTYGWDDIYSEPYIALDASGNIWVSDSPANRLEVFTADGLFIEYCGTAGPQPGQFKRPTGLCFDPDGYLYVSDTLNHRIRKFSVRKAPASLKTAPPASIGAQKRN